MSSTDAASLETRGWNHLLWLGPVVGVVGLISYYTVFNWWPITRDIPWVNLPMVWGGLVLAGLGLRRAFGGGALPVAAGGLGTLLAASCAGLLTFYVFVLSSGLPDVEDSLAVGARVPAGTLVAHDGTKVDLAAAASDKLLLVFYRGHW